MTEPCPKEKGHADGWSMFLGLILGAGLAVVVTLLATQDYQTHLVSRTNNGLVCRHDPYYPKANCEGIFHFFGPRLSELRVKP